MDDIVKRLRGYSSDNPGPHYVAMRDAADEIERLRAALRYLANASEWFVSSMSATAGESYDEALGKAREALGED